LQRFNNLNYFKEG